MIGMGESAVSDEYQLRAEQGRKDHPVPFSDAMVRALLAGEKHQTRRLLKVPKWSDSEPQDIRALDNGVFARDKKTRRWRQMPLPVIGDRMWVREAWRPRGADDRDLSKQNEIMSGCTSADDIMFRCRATQKYVEMFRWWPPMFLPRWASRITLKVKEVRVQRLHDMSTADAITEGLINDQHAGQVAKTLNCDWTYEGAGMRGSPIAVFAHLWDSLHKAPNDWEGNPYVVATSFSVKQVNVDDCCA